MDVLINLFREGDVSPTHFEYVAWKLEEIKDLLKTSKEVILFGRDESIKNKLIEDISECLGG